MVIPFIIAPKIKTRPNSLADPTVSEQIPSGPGSENVEQRHILLAGHFCNKMTEGRNYDEANQYRQSFFEEVTRRADKVSLCGWSAPI